MKSHTTDMTTGDPVKHIILFAIPTLIGNVFQQVYNLTDSMIVGRFVGSNALAAVGSTTSVTFLFFALCNGIGSGGGILISQYNGAHEDKMVKKCIVNAGLIMLLIPMIFGAAGFFAAPMLLRGLNTPAVVLNDAVMYLRYLCAGLLFVSLYNYLAAVLRALGDSRSPLYFLILSTIINVFLDILLVYYFRMGINGAALATIIAQFIAALSCGIYARKVNPYFKLVRSDFHFSMRMAFSIIRLGVPLSLQYGLIAISSMAVQRIVNSFGTVVMAAFTATNRIEQFIHQPYTTLATSLSTYCGQNFGAGKNDRVYEGFKKGLIIMAVLTVFMVLIMQLFGGAITSLFVTDKDVVELGAAGLRITSCFYIILGLLYVVRGVLTGIGDAFFALLNGIVEIIGRFTLPLFLTSYLGFGAKGIWLSSGIVWALSGLTAWIRFVDYFGKGDRPKANRRRRQRMNHI